MGTRKNKIEKDLKTKKKVGYYIILYFNILFLKRRETIKNIIKKIFLKKVTDLLNPRRLYC